jgi:hypothetical protein
MVSECLTVTRASEDSHTATVLGVTEKEHGSLVRQDRPYDGRYTNPGFPHSFISNLSDDRSTASSRTIPPLNAI